MTAHYSFGQSRRVPSARSDEQWRGEAGDWALFGATGVTGRLVLTHALSRGYRPQLIGRPSKGLEALAALHELPFRTVELGDPGALREALSGARLVLNTAGPFFKTAGPLIDAALATRCDYLDLSGEIEDLRRLLGRDAEARAAGVALIGGCGFGVAATDGLAMLVSNRLGGAERLRISVSVESAFASSGVAESTLAVLAGGGFEVRNGRLAEAPIGQCRWRVSAPGDAHGRPFASAPVADLIAALHATGVPDIVAGLPMTPLQARLLSTLSPVLPRLLRFGPVRAALANAGGHAGTVSAGSCRSTALVEGWRRGARHSARLIAAEGFNTAATFAVLAVEAASSYPISAGAHTPASAFGPEFIYGAKGVEVETSW